MTDGAATEENRTFRHVVRVAAEIAAPPAVWFDENIASVQFASAVRTD